MVLRFIVTQCDGLKIRFRSVVLAHDALQIKMCSVAPSHDAPQTKKPLQIRNLKWFSSII